MAAVSLLEALAARDERSARLVASAVVLVSQGDRRASGEVVRRVVEGPRPLFRDLIIVPHDPALVEGPLRQDAARAAALGDPLDWPLARVTQVTSIAP